MAQWASKWRLTTPRYGPWYSIARTMFHDRCHFNRGNLHSDTAAFTLILWAWNYWRESLTRRVFHKIGDSWYFGDSLLLEANCTGIRIIIIDIRFLPFIIELIWNVWIEDSTSFWHFIILKSEKYRWLVDAFLKIIYLLQINFLLQSYIK